MSTHLNLKVCHPCPFRQRPCAGACLCKADDKREDITVKAARHACPAGKFSWRGVGDWAAWAIHLLRLQVLAHWWRRLTGKPCDCGGRQNRWNKWGRKAWGRLRTAAVRVAHGSHRPSRRSSSGGSGS
jgi:hypothetical protein